jgi:heat-inducible transcriptional repressor
MSLTNLSEREKVILRALIDHYIASAEPVSSFTLARKYGLEISAATIRNTIKDLEEMELVMQPHTSAGRIPTSLGYRLYVDYLLRPDRLSKADREKIEKNISKEFTGIEQILEQTSRVMGDISRQLGVAVAPRFESGVLTRLELIPVAERRVLVVMVMKSGLARTILMEVESDLKEVGLIETSSVLNEKLCGLTIGEIRNTLKERLGTATIGDPRLIKMFIDSSDELTRYADDYEVHLGGTRHILNQPEFKDPARIRDLMNLVERRQAVYELMSRTGIEEGITVTIGVGSKTGSMKKAGGIEELSLLSSNYQAGRFRGTVGIIGPTRMPYSKLFGVVDYAARRLSEVLSE